MRRSLRTFMWSAAAAFGLAPLAASAQTALERFAQLAHTPRYHMRLETHEELDDRSEDAAFRFRHAPDASELDVLEGRGAGARMRLRDGKLTVYAPSRWFGIGRPSALDDPGVTSLRGNGLAAAELGALASCFAAHASSLREVRGPSIDGSQTTAIVFERRGATCPSDSKADRSVTADVLYVAVDSGTPLLRRRYVGREIVERWRIRDFAIDNGPKT